MYRLQVLSAIKVNRRAVLVYFVQISKIKIEYRGQLLKVVLCCYYIEQPLKERPPIDITTTPARTSLSSFTVRRYLR